MLVSNDGHQTRSTERLQSLHRRTVPQHSIHSHIAHFLVFISISPVLSTVVMKLFYIDGFKKCKV